MIHPNLTAQIPNPAERHNYLLNHWKEVTNNNTLASALRTDFLATGALTLLQNRWAPLGAFSREFSVDPIKPLAQAQIKLVTGGPTVQTGTADSPITGFEFGNATVTAIAGATAHYSSAVHVASAELNSGLRMEDLMTIAVAKLADKITEAALAPVTLANFATSFGSSNVVSAANFGFDTLQTLFGKLQKAPIKNVILDGEYLAKVLNVPSFYQPVGSTSTAWKAFGWDRICLCSNWAGASNNAVGFACAPQAVVVIAGPPATGESSTLRTTTFTIPELELTVALNEWFALASRTHWYSFDVVFGAAKGDTSAGILICSS